MIDEMSDDDLLRPLEDVVSKLKENGFEVYEISWDGWEELLIVQMN